MRVLVADDSPVYRKLLATHLEEWGFSITITKDGAETWRLLERRDCPKLILLDWVLPGIDGIEICRRIRQVRDGSAYVYVVILTGKESKNDLLEAMQAGADDYLVKPFDQMELRARLLVGKRILELQDELLAARESMRYNATHDSLTGLSNRGEIIEAVGRELERARRDKKPVSVVLADVDRFKDVNDTQGHLFGDEVLREIGRRLRSKLRVYDGVGRYGGEEFLLVLPGCDLMSVLIRADEIRNHIAMKPVVSGRLSRTVTVSMGVAVSTDFEDGDIETLLNHADRGLYRAKQNGRNRVEHIEVETSGKQAMSKDSESPTPARRMRAIP